MVVKIPMKKRTPRKTNTLIVIFLISASMVGTRVTIEGLKISNQGNLLILLNQAGYLPWNEDKTFLVQTNLDVKNG
ncbi:MAG: hypothetical protein ACTSXU_10640, partial [Promethearchaeota archaeon]